MRTYIRWLLRSRSLVLALILAMTAVSVWLVVDRATFGTSLGKMFLGESPGYLQYQQDVRSFATDETIFIALESVDPLAPGALARLEEATERIYEIPEVGRVDSVLDARRITWADGALQVRPYVGPDAGPERSPDVLLAQLQADPFVGGVLVSHDGHHATVTVDLVPDDDRPAERGPQIVQETTQALVDAGFQPDLIHEVGFLAALSAGVAQSRYTIERIFPFTALVLLIVVWLLFRRLWPVGLSMIVSLIGVTLTMGFSVLLDPQIGILHAMVPPVVLIVGFSDVIHLCSAYLIELSHGRPRLAAIEESATDVGRACLYTSLTTFVGFLGMSFVPTPALRLLGVVLGFGVAVSLLVAITLVPIVFSYMPQPKPWREGTTSRVQRVLDRGLGALARLSTGRPWWVIAGFTAVIATSLYGAAHLHIETRFSDRFDPDSEVQRDAEFFRAHFARANLIHVFVDTPEAQGLFDPDRFARLTALQEAIALDPDVEHVVSVVDLVDQIHQTMNADDPVAAARAPDSRELLAQYMLLFEMGGGSGTQRLLDFDRKRALLHVRVRDEGMRAAAATGDRLIALSPGILGPVATAHASGAAYLLGQWLGEILLGQARGLGVTMIIVTLMMMLGLRSIRLGVWSMVPNLLPLLVLAGWLGLAYDAVDSDTLILAMLAIGIGVDDTIHFMMRYRIESSRTDDPAEALRRTYDFAGRAIVMTTATLALGFAPFMLSDYYSTQMMGTLLPMTLVVALLADLLLVPALAAAGPMKVRRTAEAA